MDIANHDDTNVDIAIAIDTYMYVCIYTYILFNNVYMYTYR